MDLAISISTGTRLCANNKQECKQTKSTPLVAQKQDFQQHYKLKTSVGAVVGFLPGIFYICWLFLLKGLEPSVQLIALLLQCHKQWRIRFYSRNARDGQNVTAHHWFAEKNGSVHVGPIRPFRTNTDRNSRAETEMCDHW